MGGEENWDVKPAQIYATLTRLLEGGFIAEESRAGDGPDRRIYVITGQGRADLAEWFASPVEREHQRDEVFAKLMLAIATREADPRKVIQVQRAKLYQDLHALTTKRSKTDPGTELAHLLLLDSAAMHLEADLHWLEMVEARLDDIKRQPLPRPEIRPRGRPPKARVETEAVNPQGMKARR